MVAEKEFKITPLLTVKLEFNITYIYVNGELFNQCKYLLLNNPHKHHKQESIDSIDEAKDVLGSELEGRLKPQDLGITPEQEFRAHCSNLQAWVENNYDTRLLHSNLAFPLLKKLTEAGDLIAKRVFKEEIVKRILGNYINVKFFLIEGNYLDYLNKEEVKYVLESYREYIEKIDDKETRKKEIEIFMLISFKNLDSKYHNDSVGIYKKLAKSKTKANNLEIWYDVGIICKRNKQYNLAIKFFENVIRGNHKHVNAWVRLGTVYNSISNHPHAIKAFKKALKLDPKNIDILTLLAYEYHEVDEVNKVIKTCKKALRINSDIEEVWSLLGSAYKYFPEGCYKDKGKLDKAIKCYLHALKINPKYPFTLQELIRLYYHKKDYELARKYCLRALKIHPQSSVALDTLCEIYLKNGAYNEAINIGKNALNTKYPLGSDWERLGKVYFNIKLYQRALECFKKAQRFHPLDYDINNCLKIAFRAVENTNKAFEVNYLKIKDD